VQYEEVKGIVDGKLAVDATAAYRSGNFHRDDSPERGRPPAQKSERNNSVA
jgi:hypothetical protein